jgi:hypothetical protein
VSAKIKCKRKFRETKKTRVINPADLIFRVCDTQENPGLINLPDLPVTRLINPIVYVANLPVTRLINPIVYVALN